MKEKVFRLEESFFKLFRKIVRSAHTKGMGCDFGTMVVEGEEITAGVAFDLRDETLKSLPITKGEYIWYRLARDYAYDDRCAVYKIKDTRYVYYLYRIEVWEDMRRLGH